MTLVGNVIQQKTKRLYEHIHFCAYFVNLKPRGRNVPVFLSVDFKEKDA